MTIANQQAAAPAPVSDDDNREVNGLALCNPLFFEQTIARVMTLRQQDADYRAHLPNDPAQAVRAALDLFIDPPADSANPLRDARRFTDTVCGLLSADDGISLDEGERRETAQWAAWEANSAVRQLATMLDRLEDILRAACPH